MDSSQLASVPPSILAEVSASPAVGVAATTPHPPGEGRSLYIDINKLLSVDERGAAPIDGKNGGIERIGQAGNAHTEGEHPNDLHHREFPIASAAKLIERPNGTGDPHEIALVDPGRSPGGA